MGIRRKDLWGQSGHLQARKRASPGTQPSQNLDLRLSSLQNHEIINFCCITPYSLWYFAMAAQANYYDYVNKLYLRIFSSEFLYLHSEEVLFLMKFLQVHFSLYPCWVLISRLCWPHPIAEIFFKLPFHFSVYLQKKMVCHPVLCKHWGDHKSIKTSNVILFFFSSPLCGNVWSISM